MSTAENNIDSFINVLSHLIKVKKHHKQTETF